MKKLLILLLTLCASAHAHCAEEQYYEAEKKMAWWIADLSRKMELKAEFNANWDKPVLPELFVRDYYRNMPANVTYVFTAVGDSDGTSEALARYADVSEGYDVTGIFRPELLKGCWSVTYAMQSQTGILTMTNEVFVPKNGCIAAPNHLQIAAERYVASRQNLDPNISLETTEGMTDELIVKTWSYPIVFRYVEDQENGMYLAPIVSQGDYCRVVFDGNEAAFYVPKLVGCHG